MGGFKREKGEKARERRRTKVRGEGGREGEVMPRVPSPVSAQSALSGQEIRKGRRWGAYCCIQITLVF
jgi:hypothetical protein